MSDAVNHPAHYNAHPAGIECIDLVESLPFCPGNAIKYLWRADHKGFRLQDLEKALWYARRAERAGATALWLYLTQWARAALLKRVARGFEAERAAIICALASGRFKRAREGLEVALAWERQTS